MHFKGKNMLHYSLGKKRQQGFTIGTVFYVYNVIRFNFEVVHHSLVVIMTGFSDSRTILRWEGYDLLLDV